MPIFHDDDGFLPQDSHDEPHELLQTAGARPRRLSQRFRSNVAQQLARSPPSGDGLEQATSALSLRSGRSNRSLNRGELIQRIKRERSPSWSPELETKLLPSHTAKSSTAVTPKSPTSLLPAAEFKESAVEALSHTADLSLAAEIERPRSALHSGDFRPPRQNDAVTAGESPGNISHVSPLSSAPWQHSFLGAANSHHFDFNQGSFEDRPIDFAGLRTSSFNFNQPPFVLMPPTSPLVQQTNNPDLDSESDRQRPRSPERSLRRHTFCPDYLQKLSGSLDRSTSSPDVPRTRKPSARAGTMPYQAHQPRRSISALMSQSVSFPQTPLSRPRRPSMSGTAESSPLHHAPLVGSYEESILRGRMSTTPSRPLDFVAQIGVLGRGPCKPSLKCPSHIIIPFPAVFYSYPSGNGRLSDSEPSPYVGLVDLEHGLLKSQHTRRSRRRAISPAVDAVNMTDLSLTAAEEGSSGGRDFLLSEQPSQRLGQRAADGRRRRRQHTSRAPPGGSYRIPQQGQLQIVIKNPNKTAIKLFLVPYDLDGMEPGQKTFIRQRSYTDTSSSTTSHTSSTSNVQGDNRSDPTLASLEGYTSTSESKRSTLRYLVHIHICCTAKGRYYLYKSIRVVFANRVPDDKETLRNEIQLPEPRYSTYKPTREPASTVNSRYHPEGLPRFRTLPRLNTMSRGMDAMDGIADSPYPSLRSTVHSSFPAPPLPTRAVSAFSQWETRPWPDAQSTSPPLLQPIPFSLAKREHLGSSASHLSGGKLLSASSNCFTAPPPARNTISPAPFSPVSGTPVQLVGDGPTSGIGTGSIAEDGEAMAIDTLPSLPASANPRMTSLLSQRLRDYDSGSELSATKPR